MFLLPGVAYIYIYSVNLVIFAVPSPNSFSFVFNRAVYGNFSRVFSLSLERIVSVQGKTYNNIIRLILS